MSSAQTAYKAQLNEKESRDQLILDELPQVYYIARRIHERLPQHIPFEDLVHAGVIGLIGAVGTYDPARSVPLKSYTKFRVRGAILDSLRELDWGSRRLRFKGRQIEDAISKLSKQLGRQPDENEIAKELGISVEKLYETAQRIDSTILLGQEVGSSFDQKETHDLIESAPTPDEGPFDRYVRTEAKDTLARAIDGLSEKEQMVISLYYKEELTVKEIGAVMHLSESRISQIHTLALSKLRTALSEAGFSSKLI